MKLAAPRRRPRQTKGRSEGAETRADTTVGLQKSRGAEREKLSRKQKMEATPALTTTQAHEKAKCQRPQPITIGKTLIQRRTTRKEGRIQAKLWKSHKSQPKRTTDDCLEQKMHRQHAAGSQSQDTRAPELKEQQD
jgi:hypothetical protein